MPDDALDLEIVTDDVSGALSGAAAGAGIAIADGKDHDESVKLVENAALAAAVKDSVKSAVRAIFKAMLDDLSDW